MAVAGGIAAPTSAAEKSACLEILPVHSALVLATRDVQEMTKQWQATKLFQVYANKNAEPFWTDLSKKRGGLLPTEQLGIEWSQILATSAGEVAFAIVPLKADGAGRLLVIDVSGNNDVVAREMQNLQRRWSQQGGFCRTIRRNDVVVLERTVGQVANRFAFVHGNKWVVTDRHEILDEMLPNPKNKSGKTLASHHEFIKAWQTETNREGISFFLEPWSFQRLAGDRATKKKLNFYERHKFNAIKTITGSISFALPENDVAMDLKIAIEFPLSDVASVLTLNTAQDFTIPKLTPSGAATYHCFHWDIPTAFKAYGFYYDEAYGENYRGAFDDLLNGLAEDVEGPQVNLRTEVIEMLKGKVTRIQDYGGERTKVNPAGQRGLWLAEAKDEGKLKKSLERFFDGDPDVGETLIQDVRIWHGKVPHRPLISGGRDNPLAFSIDALGVFEGHFIVTSDRTWLEGSVQNRAAKKLIASPPQPFAATATPLSSRSWRDMAQVAESLHGRIASSNFGLPSSWDEWLVWMLCTVEDDGKRTWVAEGKRLPSFEIFRPLFQFELIDLQTTKDGWTIRGRL